MIISSRPGRSKKQIREEMLDALSAIPFPDLISKSGSLSDRFFDFARTATAQIFGRTIVSFCPFGNEPQINVEVEGGGEVYRVSYVRIDDWQARRMSARLARRDTPDLWEEFDPGNGLKVFQPLASIPLAKTEEVSVILVPGLAFTRNGSRLGRGAGFYDRFLDAHPAALRLGVAFSEQILESLPEEEWDERVDIILTDREIITTNSYGDWTNHGKIIHRNQT